MKIYSIRRNSLNEADRLELARLLVKAGYTVSIGSEKVPNRSSDAYYVEFTDGRKNSE